MKDSGSTEETIFNAARQFSEPEPRAAYLAAACGKDLELRCRIERLLSAGQRAKAFLENYTPDLPTECRNSIPEEAITESAGVVIGRYRLLEKIGEGGFGTVYVAEQRISVKRRVALKIIKLGMDTRQVVARFEAERQALALMDHPNIARVLDAGATDTGRPYFVMELVRGIPITRYCDEHNLPPVERLQLFVQVCHAIQHAHQKGIIHRDIKPTNILVTLHDGVPVPKVIDFGIAKATQGDLTDRTNYTQFQQFIGTPAYMSPEQAEMSGLDLDTRSDIYALGVLLYELLVGKTPFEAEALLRAGLDQMRRTLREQEPLRPSTRLNSLKADELTTTAKRRGLETHRLITLLRGDLDWIVMKCLEKDRGRRYETANGLAMDIKRHLNNEPVLARPPSTLYKLQKLVWRNKLAFAAGAAVFAALLLGFGFSTWEAFEKSKAYLRARRAEQEQSHLRERAEANALSARQHLYVADMLLAQQALDLGNLGRTLELLRKYQADDALRTLRGWEWRYLWQQCRSDELFLMGRHSHIVTTLAFSPDGSIMASGGHDRIVKLWDVLKRRPVGSLPHEDSIVSVAFSADGNTLATVAASQGVTLWDAKAQRELFRTGSGAMDGLPCGDSKSIAFSPTDPNVLAVGDQNGKVTLWNVSSRSRIRTLEGSTERLALTFSADGQRLVGVRPGTSSALVWDVGDGRVETRFEVESAQPHADLRFGQGKLALSPDGKFLAADLFDAVGGADLVALLDPKTGAVRFSHTNHTGWISSVVFSPDGKTLASASADHTIRLWDVAGWRETAVLRGHLHEVWSLTFSPDGKTLASGSKDETIRFWSAIPRAQDRRNLPLSDINDSSISADGQMFLSHHKDGTLSLWDAKDLRRIAAWKVPGYDFTTWASGPGGALLATADRAGKIRLWRREDQSPILFADFPGHEGSVEALKFSPGGSVLMSVGKDQQLKLWQVVSPKPLASFAAPHRQVTTVGFSSDGALLAMGFFAEKDANALLKLWNRADGKEIGPVVAHQQHISGLAFSPNGQTLATASFDGTVKLWSVASLECNAVFKGPLFLAASVCFSPEGGRLAFGSDGGTIRIWDMTTRQEVASLRTGTGYQLISSISFIGADTLFAYTGGEGAFVWRAASFDQSDGE